MEFSQFNFGEYDARREFLRQKDFFLATFIDPISFQLNTLKNYKNYIIVGQKGAGKTACQIFLEVQKEQSEGYICSLISFFDDLNADDYKDFSRTQRIDLLDIKDLNSIELMYDFKEVWKRLLFIRISKILRERDRENAFVAFCLSSVKGFSKLVDGIKKSLKVEIKIPLFGLESKVSFDPSVFEGNEVSLKDFNHIAEQLFIKECRDVKLYFFVDEIVISTYNTQSDDYKIRTALIRDLVRMCCYFNDTCVKNNMDVHFICSLRPEIRTLLNGFDPEISKIMDGNDVFLSWNAESLLEIMTQKIVNGAPAGSKPDAEVFLPESIRFGGYQQEFLGFLLNQTWRKPRDIIRFLKSYATMNPRHHAITEDGVKNCLNEYARVSATEIFEQLSVDFSPATLESVRTSIKRNSYSDADDFKTALGKYIQEKDIDAIVKRLYESGVIGNIDRSGSEPRYFFYHRQEEYLDPDMSIMVHTGLWNYFNIRHR